MEVKETLVMLTSALVAITTQVDHLTHGRALQVATLSAQPGTSAGENPTAAPSAFFDPNTEEHRSKSSQPPLLAITNDDTDGEEEVVLPAPRKSQTTLCKLRSADTSAIHQVMWPTSSPPKVNLPPTKSLTVMAFVNGYLTIMDLQPDALRIKMSAHLK